MLIVADKQIPLLQYFFDDVADVEAIAASEFCPQAVAEADIVLVRSTVKVNEALFTKHRPRFIGSCVSGQDHLDQSWLQSAGIAYYCATGCNAVAVQAYVNQVISILHSQSILPKTGQAAVIGVGHVGSLVAHSLNQLGYQVRLCDPIRVQQQADFQHQEIDQLLDSDLICLHTPLTKIGPYPTYQLFNADRVSRLKPGAVLLNAGRGAVIAPDALMRSDIHYCLDVWPTEPEVVPQWLENSALATPHIAGHTILGKCQGTAMVYQALAEQFGWPKKPLPQHYHDNQHRDLLQYDQQFRRAIDNSYGSTAQVFKQMRMQYCP